MKTLVIGLGNPILTDDGVGVIVAYKVQEALAGKNNRDVTVTEACVGGLRLMEMMEGYDRVILIDAIMGKQGSPGSVYKMTMDDLQRISPTQHSASSHDTTLVTALDAGRALGLHLPEDIRIFAIEVSNILDFNENPTAAVAAVIPDVTTAVLHELNPSA